MRGAERVVEDARLHRARREQQQRIGAHLGFSGEEAFRRAFVRWTGIAPSRFRRDCSAADVPFHQT
ncbi:hypothetical protein Bamb_3885 [Burkholderia ambifaria AMMD]|uniref:HTH araC/xylS-type domain-containing protein n=1 Tax=Burkholderia ambifaria (strain ATCC BAA-244 / DSM 16087 / CCUG 44356 / LMG 19182 / AMMD) TaxID=339670 RepID=Q0B8T4_BURCM|nr:hypothetical protein Bamb_3885 [Burkholderia ambifaria AMMD]